MIIYNVTVNIEDDVRDNWVEWMKATHIPQVMATGYFVSFNFSKLLNRQEDETGTTYVIQYTALSMEHYNTYQENHAPALQAETKRLYEGKFVAFRTIMESV
ncbi:MAG: DUF4286 family protein [Bacteroidia bacterium]|nr:DUF4286 family protein [Bacteroidia bacterium]MCZ2141561.1 DUF4286 family protein [Bacteroidia bacterium]